MKKKLTFSKIVLLVCFLLGTTVFSQVGIGTVTPEASSILDVTSTTQGMLTPRMTTAQRIAIVSPTDGLIVYDTDLKSFYHYNSTTTSWIVINSGTSGRLKFKRIKSTDVLATILAAEKLAGGSKYLLDTNTYYEINGTINFDFPIDLNNAYVSGQDANEDKLVRTSGNLFEGATGGSIRNVTLQVTGGGKVFNLSGTSAQNIIIRDLVIAGSSNVGSITSFGLVFVSIVQYVGNSNGIVYDSISKLLLSNAAWFSNNGGTYEKLQGTFDLVQKQGGFMEVSTAQYGFDVSSNPTINGDAVMESVVFTGTNTAGYVRPYPIANTYTGYGFSNAWNVRCPGIPTEVDASASGNLYDASNTGGPRTTVSNINTGYKLVTNATTASNLFRFTSPASGRLTYKGKKTRTFQVSSSLSFIESTSGTNAIYLFYIAKRASNGTTVTALPETETYIDTNSGFAQAFPITGTVTLAQDESVEVWVKRINTGTKINIDTYSFNLSVR